MAMFWHNISALRHRADAMALLQAVYDRFTEGFDTADLREAKSLLEHLT
jgi:predicted ATPase